jgi:hypothetical protein
MRNKITHTEARKLLATQLQERVCYLLNWTAEEYTAFQYKQGCLYVQMYLSKNPEIIDELLANRIFWAWWRNEWANRDDVYVHNTEVLHLANRMPLYRQLHDAETMILDMQPPASAFALSYCKMIGEVIKQQTRP